MKVAFVRTAGERDRIYATRSDGSEASWAFPPFGDGLPHDLVHLLVESAFGLSAGFWGRVDGGADPAAITAQANRTGGRDKYAAYGKDQSQLRLAEALANIRWLAEEASLEGLRDEAMAACAVAGVALARGPSLETVERLRTVMAHLTGAWSGLRPKGALNVHFDPEHPETGFEELWSAAVAAR